MPDSTEISGGGEAALFDEGSRVPVIFNRDFANKRNIAPYHQGAGLAGGAQYSIAQGIEALNRRASEGVGEKPPKGTVSRWTVETSIVGRWAREQRLIIAHDEITRLPLGNYLSELGFVAARGFGQWYRPIDGIYLGDVRDDNFLEASEGIQAIDLTVDQFSQKDLRSLGLKSAEDLAAD